MKFPNAFSGVKKIFVAEILSIIAAVLVLIFGIVGLSSVAAGASAAAAQSEAGITGALVGFGFAAFFGIASGIVLIIAYILQLVGVINGMKDEPAFKTSLIFIIVALACSIISSVASGNATVSSIFSVIQNIAQLCVTLFIIQGIRNLADKLGNTAVSDKGRKIYMLIAIIFGISILANIIALFAPAIASILSIVASVISIVQIIIFLTFLSNAKKMLAA